MSLGTIVIEAEPTYVAATEAEVVGEVVSSLSPLEVAYEDEPPGPTALTRYVQVEPHISLAVKPVSGSVQELVPTFGAWTDMNTPSPLRDRSTAYHDAFVPAWTHDAATEGGDAPSARFRLTGALGASGNSSSPLTTRPCGLSRVGS
jgi:hypothetical protein